MTIVEVSKKHPRLYEKAVHYACDKVGKEGKVPFNQVWLFILVRDAWLEGKGIHVEKKDTDLKKRHNMKQTIYISLPISGQEDTYEQRLAAAVECVKERFPDAEIITPKDVATGLKAHLEHIDPTYGQYLGADIATIIDKCNAVFFGRGWIQSKGCNVEHVVAKCFEKECYCLGFDEKIIPLPI